jgi:hypothetical protein
MNGQWRLTPKTPPTVIITVGRSSYLLDEVKAVVDGLDGEERYLPATSLLHSDFDGIESEEAILATFKAIDDDVWSADFLEGM